MSLAVYARPVKRAILGLATLVVVIGLGLWLTLSTRVGARFVVGQLHRLSVPISVQQVGGRLRGPLSLQGIEYQTEGIRLHIDTLTVDWRLGGLLRKRLTVDDLRVIGVDISVRPAPEASAELQHQRPVAERRARPPIDLFVQRALIQDISIGAPGNVLLEGGRLRAAGRLDDYLIEAETQISSPQIPHGHLRLAARGGLENLDMDTIRVDLLDGRVHARGRVAWQPQLEWRLDLEATDLAPALLFPEPDQWPGRLSLRANSAGTLNAAGLVGRFTIDTLYGSLRQQPVSARASAAIEGARYALPQLKLRWGSARLSAAGELGDELDLSFDAAAPELRALYPGANGSFEIRGSLGGTRSLPAVQATVSARALDVGAVRLAQLAGRLQLDAGRPDRARIDLRGRRIAIGKHSIDALALRAQGARSADDPAALLLEQAQADLLDGRVHARGRIAWQPELEWCVDLEATDLAPAPLFPQPAQWPGRLSLRASSSGALGDTGPVASLAIDTLYGSLRQQTVSARASAAIEGARYALPQLELRWGSAHLSAAGELGDELDLSFDAATPDLRALYPGANGSFETRGHLGGTRSLPTVDARVTAQGLGFETCQIGELAGRLSLGLATVKTTELDLTATQLHVAHLPIDRLAVQGRGIRTQRALTGLALDQVEIDLLGGQLRTNGQVTWKPQVEWDLSLRADSVAPAPLLPNPAQWPGRLSLRARTEGALSDPGPVARLQIDTLYGSLRHQAISARVSASADGERYSLPELAFLWGPTRLSAAGSIADVLDLSFELKAPDLSMAYPDARGSITVVGRLDGSRSFPEVVSTLSAQDVEVADYRLQELRGQVNVDLAEPGKLEIDLEAARFLKGDLAVDLFALQAQGTRAKHELRTILRSTDGNLTLRLDGGLEDDGWRGELRQLDLLSALAGNWSLAAPASLAGSRAQASLEGLCLRSGTAALCAAGSWQRGAGWGFTSSMQQLPVAAARALFPAGWSATGTLDGRIAASAAADGTLSGELDLQPGPGAIGYPITGDTQTVRYERGSLRARAGPGGVSSEIDLAFTGSSGGPLGMLAVKLRLPDFTAVGQPLSAQPLTGHVQARLENLSIVEPLFPRLVRTSGRLEVDMEAAGSVAAPRLRGELRLRDGQADVPALGLRLREIELTAAGDGEGRVAFSGSITSGPGRLIVSGESPVIPSAVTPSRLRFQGDRFQAVNTPEVQLLVSPDLQAELSGQQIKIGGEVTIPLAAIELREIPETAVPPSKDVVFVGPAAEPRPEAVRVSGRVRLLLGEDVSFRGFGFSASLAGSILAIEEPAKPTAGSGELAILDGRYKAYGQDLKIDPGRVLFGGGPIDNPALDMRAYRTASDSVIAGLIIKGTLKSPQITLFSEPPMAESDALSYLVLGRPLAEASRTEGSVTSRAASSLGLRGGDLLARKIAATFGLAEARIETRGSLQEASLVAGKYLSPRLYVAYGIGLFDHISTFQVRYLLSSKWTLLGKSGEATSADLLYRIERGE